MSKQLWRDRFDPEYDPDAYATDCSKGIGADQSFKDECSIEWLLRRSGVLGGYDQVQALGGMYEDFSGVPDDYLAAVNLVESSQDQFDSLPVAIRNRFKNSPHQLLSFLADVGNREEAVSLGLLEKPVAPADGARAAAPAGAVVSPDVKASTPS